MSWFCTFSGAGFYVSCAPGTYKASLLRAFSRTVEEGRFPFVIVDAPNIRVDDFKDYWSVGQVKIAPSYLNIMNLIRASAERNYHFACLAVRNALISQLLFETTAGLMSCWVDDLQSNVSAESWLRGVHRRPTPEGPRGAYFLVCGPENLYFQPTLYFAYARYNSISIV